MAIESSQKIFIHSIVHVDKYETYITYNYIYIEMNVFVFQQTMFCCLGVSITSQKTKILQSTSSHALAGRLHIIVLDPVDVDQALVVWMKMGCKT